jgi:hypothetical protein
MHRRRWGIWVLIITTGVLLLSGGGCSWCKTRQGWVLQSGWSLEFQRMPFFCGRASECTEGCAVQTPREPDCVSKSDKDGEVLKHANPQQVEKLGSSPFAKLMEKRGRLGICAGCGQMGRFKEPGVKEQAPPAPVIAKFVPVPSQPVFCPREETMQPVAYQQAAKQKERVASAPKKKSPPKAPLPEEIPAPPVASNIEKTVAAAPRQLNIPPEPTSWIFSPPPESKPDQLSEALLPPRPSERAARR